MARVILDAGHGGYDNGAQYVDAHPDQVCPAKWRPGKETLVPSFDLVGKI